MRNINNFFMALLSTSHCCCAYDLELSSYAISLLYETLCSISYATYVVRLVNLSYGGCMLSILVTDALVEDS
jgi:galactokinase